MPPALLLSTAATLMAPGRPYFRCFVAIGPTRPRVSHYSAHSAPRVLSDPPPCTSDAARSLVLQVQPEKRVTDDGVIVHTAEKQHQGVRYVRALLDDGVDFHAWVDSAVKGDMVLAGGKYMYPCVGIMWGRLLRKLQAGETWHLPDSRYGGGKRGGTNRAICRTHPKEMIFALKKAFNRARGELGQRPLEDGYFQVRTNVCVFLPPTCNSVSWRAPTCARACLLVVGTCIAAFVTLPTLSPP
eukprot:3053238-Prymnesium_polylepis.1